MTDPIQYLSFEAATQLWLYEPDTGVIRSRADGRVVSSKPTEPCYYSSVYWRGKQIRTARLAWLLTHGTWPAHVIDHINGDRHDDRIANLRDVPHAVNQLNQNYHRAGLTRPEFLASKRASRALKPRHFMLEAEIDA